jgi:hypothetical protein
MAGFLNYLDDFDNKIKKITEEIVVKEPEKKSKVLCLNVEVRSVDGAKLVIEKLQDWITRQGGTVVKETVQPKKQTYKIPPKKVVTSPVVESRSRAVDILDGLPDTPVVSELSEQVGQGNINTFTPQMPQHNLETVSGHASALL